MTQEMEERNMRILMYEWNLQQCFRATGINYLLSLNYTQSEADEFMHKFVPLDSNAGGGGPPERKKQKSDPPAIEQFNELTKAKLMAKMNELGVTDYNPRWKKQQLIDHLEKALATKKEVPSSAEENNEKERSPMKPRAEWKARGERPVPASQTNTSTNDAVTSPARGLVQRAIAQHESRQKAPAREVSCESAVKEPRPNRSTEDENAVVEVVIDPRPPELIDVTMIEAEDDSEEAEPVESTAKLAPTSKETEPPTESAPSKPATTPAKSSPSIQIGKVQSAKKLLLGQGLSDPLQQPVRFPRKQTVNKGMEQPASKKPEAAEPVVPFEQPKVPKEPRPQIANLFTPSLKQQKTNASPSYAYKMKERHAKLLMERNKRKDQLKQAKINLPSNPTIDLNDNPEALFDGPADAERVLKDLREKYKTGGDKPKTEYKAPVAQPYKPLSTKPEDGSKDAPFTVSTATTTNKKPSKSGKSAQDNYPMTDTEDSDYDTDDSEANAARRAKKHIPSWARTKNLAPVLEAQNHPSCPIDPDKLFGVVTTCDLEAVFNRKSSRYRRPRTSGVWVTNTAA